MAETPASLQHPLQFLPSLLNLLLQLRQPSSDHLRRTVLDRFVHHFLVAVDREVVVVRGDLGLGDEEALVGALALRSSPSRFCQRVRMSGRLFFACSSASERSSLVPGRACPGSSGVRLSSREKPSACMS